MNDRAQDASRTPRNSDEEAVRILTTRANSREWTPETIQRQPLGVVMLALQVVDSDNPSLTARISPQGMPPENFHNMLLREMDRRNAFGQYVYGETVPPRPGEATPAPNDALERVVRFIRPQLALNGVSVAAGENKETNVTPGDAALYDAATTSILFERYSRTENGRTIYPELVLSRDVVSALNLPPAPNGTVYTSGPITDVGRRTLGYAFASVDAFNPLHSNGPLLVALTPQREDGTPVPFGEIQGPYCQSVSAMYQAGEQMNPRDAFVSGFIQGRVNDRNPEASNPAIGITAACPVPQRAVAGARR